MSGPGSRDPHPRGRRLRVLLAHDYGTLNGGAELMMEMLQRGLRQRGHEVLLLTSTARPLPLPLISDAVCFGTVSPARRLLKVANPFARHRMRRLLAEFRPHVVHLKMFMTQLSPLVLAPLRAVPTLHHVVNYDLICPLNTKTLPDGSRCRERPGSVCRRSGCLPWAGVARSAVQRRLVDLSVFDRIVANSRWVAERLRAEDVPVHSVLSNSVPSRPPRPALEDPPRVSFAGRLIWKKGVDVLVRAMVEVRRRVPECRLVIAGEGPARAALERDVADRGLAEAIEFLGHLDRDGVERAVDGAWVHVVPSRWDEPFGLSATEGMMRGTATVVSDAGGLAEQVVDGETGFRVPAQDSAALARAITRIVEDRPLAERLGAAGRRRALEEYSEERHLDRVEELYEELTAPGAP